MDNFLLFFKINPLISIFFIIIVLFWFLFIYGYNKEIRIYFFAIFNFVKKNPSFIIVLTYIIASFSVKYFFFNDYDKKENFWNYGWENFWSANTYIISLFALAFGGLKLNENNNIKKENQVMESKKMVENKKEGTFNDQRQEFLTSFIEAILSDVENKGQNEFENLLKTKPTKQKDIFMDFAENEKILIKAPSFDNPYGYAKYTAYNKQDLDFLKTEINNGKYDYLLI